MAQGENRAAGLFKGTVMLLIIYLIVPPAVFLAVNNVFTFLDRGNAGNGDRDADGFRILFSVYDGRGQGIDGFFPGTEGSDAVERILSFFSLKL